MSEFVSIPAICVICYLVGFVMKRIPSIKDEIIPAVMMIAGLILGVLVFYTAPELMAASDIYTAIAIGIVSGATATTINQIVKQGEKLSNEE